MPEACPVITRNCLKISTGSPWTTQSSALCLPEKRVFYKVSDGRIVSTKLDESNWQQPAWNYSPAPSQIAGGMWDDVPLASPIPNLAGDGPFKPTWDSLLEYEAPDWYQRR